jgi:hypothetical protein
VLRRTLAILLAAGACAAGGLAHADAPPAAVPVPPAALSTGTATANASMVPPAPAAAPTPLAGYDGNFFLRDPNDWFVLYPKGRLQLDLFFFPARGAAPAGVVEDSADDKRPKTTAFARRARAEMVGTIGKHVDFIIAGEFGTVPGAGQYGTLTDCFMILDWTPFARLQFGQFDVPFTQENRTSDRFFDFMERSLAVRAFGVPANKDMGAMVWGYTPNKAFYYSIGLFNGDGQSFKNQDNWPAIIGRAFIAPLAPWANGRRWMEEFEVGASGWWQRTSHLGLAAGVGTSTTGATQNDIAAMTTQGGFGFFSSSYKNGSFFSHLAPNGDIAKWAVEAHIPWRRLGLKWELVHQSIQAARWDDATGLPRNAGSAAQLDGYGTYVELYAWILGDREILEPPGIEPMPRLKAPFRPVDEPRWGLMVAARYEYLGFTVSGLPSTMGAGGTTVADPAQGSYKVHAGEIGLNAWFTRHVRATANYVANYVDGDAALIQKNLYFNKIEHELLFRLAIAL